MLSWLADLVDVDHYAVPVVGPRVWWAGPLNVEALALESVQWALRAANALGLEHATEVRVELVARRPLPGADSVWCEPGWLEPGVRHRHAGAPSGMSPSWPSTARLS